MDSILPIMGTCYMLQYMDKVTLGYTTQLGLPEQLVKLFKLTLTKVRCTDDFH